MIITEKKVQVQCEFCGGTYEAKNSVLGLIRVYEELKSHIRKIHPKRLSKAQRIRA